MTRRPPHGDLGALSPSQLRKARALLRMTQAELGQELGVSKMEIYRKELGIDKPEHRPVTRVQVLAIRWLLHREGLSRKQIEVLTGRD
jgi:DNA-binding XRE family transcriptional regulator